jgi:LysR family transcriptional activator of nhaA
MQHLSQLNYHHLFYFKTIAQEGSLAKSSEKLRISQPALSNQLKSLEQSLGMRLFERKGNRLNLTEEGQLALSYAQKIFHYGSELVDVLKNQGESFHAQVRLATLGCVPRQVLTQLVDFAKKHSSCDIEITNIRQDEINFQLSNNLVDLVVSNVAPALSTDVFFKSIARDNLAIYGARGFLGLRKNFPDSLNGQSFILPAFQSPLRVSFESWVKTHNLSTQVYLTCEDIATRKFVALDGQALLVASSFSVNQQILEGQLHKIGVLEGTFEDLFLIVANKKILNKSVTQVFKSFRL